MPEVDLEAQNPAEQPAEPAQPEGGEEESNQQNEETPPVEDKKSRDFEQGMHKWRERAKELETELNSFKSQPANQQVEQNDNQEEAIDQLRNLIREEIAPVRGELESGRRDAAVERVGKMPYTAEYADEIVEEAKSMPKELSFEKRLEMGRANVIARNLDTIMSTTKQAGINEAYDHQSVKGLRPLGEAPAKIGRDTKTMLDRYESGEMSDKEFLENQVEIDKLRREKLGF